jgi:hypothetical protein
MVLKKRSLTHILEENHNNEPEETPQLQRLPRRYIDLRLFPSSQPKKQ